MDVKQKDEIIDVEKEPVQDILDDVVYVYVYVYVLAYVSETITWATINKYCNTKVNEAPVTETQESAMR